MTQEEVDMFNLAFGYSPIQRFLVEEMSQLIFEKLDKEMMSQKPATEENMTHE